MSKPNHRSNPPEVVDPEYQKIIKAFKINPGYPLPRIKQSKPVAPKRVYHRGRR